MSENIFFTDHIFEQTGILAFLDAEGVYRFVNDTWQRQTGISREEAVGTKAADLLRGSEALTAMRSGRTISGMNYYTSASGKKFTAAARYRPVKDSAGRIAGCAVESLFETPADAATFASSLENMGKKNEKLMTARGGGSGAKYTLDDILGISTATLRLKEQIITAAGTSATCLVEGETGTGKELVAHAIHNLSARSSFPFVRVNCSAIPETLMESEFFGYEEGSFTGGVKGGRAGKFEQADHGSMFLDEINAMDLTMQPKLLRALQEKEIERIGGSEPVDVDVRIIAASNRPLMKLVEEGTFRQDLFYRLNIIHIVIPPLRARPEDIAVLVESFIKRYNAELGRNITSISDDALLYLEQKSWPGNIRELQNNVERAMIVCRGNELTKADFTRLSDGETAAEAFPEMKPARSAEKKPGQSSVTTADAAENQNLSLSEVKHEIEKKAVVAALEAAGGNKTKAAEKLGISRTLLYRKLKKYGIS